MPEAILYWSQSLSGWDGVFHLTSRENESSIGSHVAIPFRVGWGFSHRAVGQLPASAWSRRNPFQGGMGFFTTS